MTIFVKIFLLKLYHFINSECLFCCYIVFYSMSEILYEAEFEVNPIIMTYLKQKFFIKMKTVLNRRLILDKKNMWENILNSNFYTTTMTAIIKFKFSLLCFVYCVVIILNQTYMYLRNIILVHYLKDWWKKFNNQYFLIFPPPPK